MNLFNNIIKNKKGTITKSWHKGILIRTAFLSWILIILTLLIFIFGTLPFQLRVIKNRMKSEANDIAGSIGQVTATAIINNDYGFTVDHCLKIIKQSNSILYITITRKDGFSLVHTADGWKQSMVKDYLNLPPGNEATNEFVYSKLVNQDVFHYSYPFNYSGIDWGRINVGLSLKVYNQNINDLYLRTVGLAALSIFIGLLASVYFAKKLTAPIRELDNVAQLVAGGDLNARVNIFMENELGRLAHSFNRMTSSLQNSQDNLEKKVEERTADLEKINKMMQVEINDRLAAENTLKQYNIRLEALDKIYRGMISAKSVEDIVSETINQLQKLYSGACAASVNLFELKANEEVIFSKKFNPGLFEKVIKKVIPINENPEISTNINNIIEKIIKGNEGNFPDITLSQKNINSYLSVPLVIDDERIGTLNILSENVDAFSEEHREVLFILANQLAVAIHQAQLQERINQHAKSLQNSLSEKEVLLKEIHHRVKNNLQVISSLLYLNSKKIKDKETLDMFKDSQNRVKSIALVHERLYQSKDLGRIDFKEYIQKLTYDLFRSYAVNPSLVKLEINIDKVSIDIDSAVPCGLIINELISNALKYAFLNYEAQNKMGIITISLIQLNEKEVYLTVSDNGVGITGNLDEKKKQSLGLQLVDTLVDQLEGTLEIDVAAGTEFKIKLKV